jgi:uncharacterized protein (TIGR03435 family)
LAYGVRPFQISGGPKWIDTFRFDIDARLTTSSAAARANPGLTMEDQRKTAEALRSLLADRFLLTFHRDTIGQVESKLSHSHGLSFDEPPRSWVGPSSTKPG